MLRKQPNLASQRKRNIRNALGLSPRSYLEKSRGFKQAAVGKANGTGIGWKAAAMPVGSSKSAVGRFKWKGEPAGTRIVERTVKVPGRFFRQYFDNVDMKLPNGKVLPARQIEAWANGLEDYSRGKFDFEGLRIEVYKRRSWPNPDYEISTEILGSIDTHRETVDVASSLSRKRMGGSSHVKAGGRGQGPAATGTMAARRTQRLAGKKARKGTRGARPGREAKKAHKNKY